METIGSSRVGGHVASIFWLVSCGPKLSRIGSENHAAEVSRVHSKLELSFARLAPDVLEKAQKSRLSPYGRVVVEVSDRRLYGCRVLYELRPDPVEVFYLTIVSPAIAR